MSQGSVPMLRSYTGGAWRTAGGEGVALHDAVTGDPIARISSAGIDMAAALDHGRRVGGPALRELTFHQRAALLKALGSHLREHREELYALSARTGATLGDAKFDVDGGIAVLNAYAGKGRRELPNDTMYVDGGGRAAQQGWHVRRPAHRDPAARRGDPDQRVQLPGLGAAGEAGPRVPGRDAEPDQAGQPDRVPD